MRPASPSRLCWGWEAAAAGAQRLGWTGIVQQGRDLQNWDEVCPTPVDSRLFLSYFSIFKRMSHFLDSCDPEAKCSWSSTAPTLVSSIIPLPPPPSPRGIHSCVGEVLLGLTSLY